MLQLKNSKCDKTQNVTKLKKSKCDKTHTTKCDKKNVATQQIKM